MIALGTRLGQYEILSQLRAGGMGEIYRGRDNWLDRTVAVKMLLSEKMTDTERKRRFVQEARAASALNHPNIVTIYDPDERWILYTQVDQAGSDLTLVENFH
jgi:serine/threonine protein kinase